MWRPDSKIESGRTGHGSWTHDGLPRFLPLTAMPVDVRDHVGEEVVPNVTGAAAARWHVAAP